ncbi:MAG TPA: NAD(P)-binding domain-containing protein [Armatimonadaceae bacterium]|nr:NAD(P)-binding domain-containing protein [Armatimonadaceae bacterium]
MPADRPVVCFLGVGAMGGPMARHLAAAGYPVTVLDRDPERLATAVASGARAAEDGPGAVRVADVVCTSLPSSESWVALAQSLLLPNARPGKLFIDFGTGTPPETRRIGAALAERGALLVDAPVSGGPDGAERARLRCFAGGDPDAFERARPILETVCGADGLTYCGPCGAGQVVKGVNQLAMGLGAAAYLEAVAFGVRAGVEPDVLGRAVGGEGEHWRAMLLQAARAARDGRAEQIGVKFRELPYYLAAADAAGFGLPLTRALYEFCDAGERVVTDDNRPAPSFWHELTTGDKPKGSTD